MILSSLLVFRGKYCDMYVTGLFKLSFYHLNPRWNWHILNLYLLNPCLDGHIFTFWIHMGNDIFWAYAFLIRVWIDIFFTCWIYNWTDILWYFELLSFESIGWHILSFESLFGLAYFYMLNPYLYWTFLSLYLLNPQWDW